MNPFNIYNSLLSINVLYEYFIGALMNFYINHGKTSKYFVEDQCNHVMEKSF